MNSFKPPYRPSISDAVKATKVPMVYGMLQNRKVTVFHHLDLDGYFGAVGAYAFFDRAGKGQATYIPVNYGQDKDIIDKTSVGDIVIFIDFCPKKETLLALKEKTSYVLVIDHHKTTEEASVELAGHNWIGFFYNTNCSGALLAWDYFNAEYENEYNPYFVYLADDYDTWNHLTKESRYLNFAFNDNKELRDVKRLFDEFVSKSEKAEVNGSTVLTHGAYLSDVINRRIESSVKRLTEKDVITINGRRGCLYNEVDKTLISLLGSAVYNNPNLDVDFSLSFCVTTDLVLFSMRSKPTGIDCRVICESFGGGGHIGAAGFSLPLKEGFDLIMQLRNSPIVS